MIELAGIGRECPFGRPNDQQLVLIVHPVVRDDVGDEFTRRLVRVGIDAADGNCGIGIFSVRCKIVHGVRFYSIIR